MYGTYLAQDVTLLLKDISGMVEPTSTAERERRIQGGGHYSEMLPIEYEPTSKYMEIYHSALQRFSRLTAQAVANVCARIVAEKGNHITLVSLARAGISIGVLIKRYLKKHYGIDAPHYAVSIIRGRGIDQNAMRYILNRHEAASIQFVDGWIGKGAIQRELNQAVLPYEGVSPDLAVLSDPAGIVRKAGTREDFLIASSCLNATVCGLLSRTFLRSDIIGPTDYHGAAFYAHLADRDVTYEFIGAVEAHFEEVSPEIASEADITVCDEARQIADHFGIRDVNLVKPGIGEATRVLLRRMPWKILVHRMDDELYLAHLYRLAEEKGVEVVEYPLKHYRACGLIRDLTDT